MSTSSQILGASIGGSVELLTLSAAGAAMVHIDVFTQPVTSALSRAVYLLFIPSLVFGSILETTHSALMSVQQTGGNASSLQEIWVPVALALIVYLITAFIAFPITRLVARHKQEAVKRAIFACLILGNANTMPLLVMQSLCETFPPMQTAPQCYAKSMGYASLFLTVVNIVSWTALFQYLMYSPDSSVTVLDEEQALLQHSSPPPPQHIRPLDHEDVDVNRHDPVKEAITKALLSPPFIAVVSAMTCALITPIGNAFLHEDGAMRPFFLSINIVGGVVVPVSCMIVGAELYRSLSANSEEPQVMKRSKEEEFGTQTFIVILLVRMVVLPMVARGLYTALNLSEAVHNPLLGVFGLVEFNVPTANNTVIMVSIAAEALPRIGRQLRQDVAKAVFWQFLATPVFLTLNTAAALHLLYEA
ncbi:unnamed protein product [Agarophyton chilense]